MREREREGNGYKELLPLQMFWCEMFWLICLAACFINAFAKNATEYIINYYQPFKCRAFVEYVHLFDITHTQRGPRDTNISLVENQTDIYL